MQSNAIDHHQQQQHQNNQLPVLLKNIPSKTTRLNPMQLNWRIPCMNRFLKPKQGFTIELLQKKHKMTNLLY